jgi:hypothetical protein
LLYEKFTILKFILYKESTVAILVQLILID